MAEVASAYVSLVPSARGFGSKLTSQVGGEVDGAGKRLGSGFGRAFGALAAVGAGAALGSFFKGAIDGASGLVEAGTKIEAIFGKGSQAVQDFASKGAQALGQTKLEVLNASATFGTFGKAAGLSGGKLAEFSTGFTSLATDLASFNNTTPEQAVEAIGSALRGEAEPMRQFGVLLDDATLRNEALKLGLIETTKEALTPQQKVLAAQAAIYKQTTDAQGDFERTSGGLANQQRILSASFKDLQASIGAALLPVVTKFVTFLNTSMIPGLTALGSFLSANVGPAFAAIGAAISGVFSGGAGGGFLASLTAIGAAIQVNFLPVLQTMGETFTGTLLPAVTALASYLAAQLFPVFTQIAGIISGQVVPIVASLAQFLYGTLYPAIIGVATAVLSNLRPVFEALVSTFQGSVLPAVQQLLAKFREWQPTIQKVIGVIVQIIGKVLEFAAAVLGKVLPPVIKFAGFLLSNLVPAVAAVIGVVIKVIAKAIEFGEAVVNAVRTMIGWVKDKAGAAWESFKDKLFAVVEAVRPPIQTVIDKVSDLVTFVRDKATGVWDTLKTKAVGAFNAILGPIQSVVNAVQAAIDKVQGLIDKIQSIPGVPGGGSAASGTLVGGMPRIAQPAAPKSQLSGVTSMGDSSVIAELRALRTAVYTVAPGVGNELNNTAARAARSA